jgi:membrane protease YdiL (CAAX protease family)
MQATDELSELADRFGWRSLRFGCGVAAITLALLTLAFTAFWHDDYLAVAGQLAAIAFALAAGLLWRGARLRTRKRERVVQRLLAGLAAVAARSRRL